MPIMNWLRRQLNEILGLFFLSFGVTPTDEMKKQLGIAKQPERESKDEPSQDEAS
jgi:hypothetical protein